MTITTHHSHCGNKVNRQLDLQHGCVFVFFNRVYPSEVSCKCLEDSWMLRIEACGRGEVNVISGEQILQYYRVLMWTHVKGCCHYLEDEGAVTVEMQL